MILKILLVTPLVLIDQIGTNVIYGKLEGNNPAGSIKDRPAIRMIKDAEDQGIIKKGDTLIEATSGNTGTLQWLPQSKALKSN